jgi:hypothetical protein
MGGVMIRKTAAAMLLAVAPLAALQGQAMPVSQFLAKADALQQKGAMALFSSDFRLLKREIQNSGKQLRAEQDTARKAGRKPGASPPKKAAMNSSELLAHFRSIPPEQRNMPVKAALAGLMRKKYPC